MSVGDRVYKISSLSMLLDYKNIAALFSFCLILIEVLLFARLSVFFNFFFQLALIIIFNIISIVYVRMITWTLT